MYSAWYVLWSKIKQTRTKKKGREKEEEEDHRETIRRRQDVVGQTDLQHVLAGALLLFEQNVVQQIGKVVIEAQRVSAQMLELPVSEKIFC